MEKASTQSDQLSAGWERVSEELSDAQVSRFLLALTILTFLLTTFLPQII